MPGTFKEVQETWEKVFAEKAAQKKVKPLSPLTKEETVVLYGQVVKAQEKSAKLIRSAHRDGKDNIVYNDDEIRTMGHQLVDMFASKRASRETRKLQRFELRSADVQSLIRLLPRNN